MNRTKPLAKGLDIKRKMLLGKRARIRVLAPTPAGDEYTELLLLTRNWFVEQLDTTGDVEQFSFKAADLDDTFGGILPASAEHLMVEVSGVRYTPDGTQIKVDRIERPGVGKPNIYSIVVTQSRFVNRRFRLS